MKIKFAMVLTASGLLFAGTAGAESLVEGDAEAGKARAITCTACHGPEGNSSSPLWPNIAGQNASYTLAQLKAFKDGTRSDPLMSSQAMMLSDEDMANLAVYFESLPAAVQTVADASTVEGAAALYRGGDMADKTAACIACHGQNGISVSPNWPTLAGQHQDYLEHALNQYRDGTRKDPVMAQMAAALTDDDVAVLVRYYSGLEGLETTVVE